MKTDPHMQGFEKEQMFIEAFSILYSECNSLKTRHFEQAISILAPDFVKGLFEDRPCDRKLKYIGEETANSFFGKDQIYTSLTFNGGTYTIDGYDKRIGCTYFEIVE